MTASTALDRLIAEQVAAIPSMSVSVSHDALFSVGPARGPRSWHADPVQHFTNVLVEMGVIQTTEPSLVAAHRIGINPIGTRAWWILSFAHREHVTHGNERWSRMAMQQRRGASFQVVLEEPLVSAAAPSTPVRDAESRTVAQPSSKAAATPTAVSVPLQSPKLDQQPIAVMREAAPARPVCLAQAYNPYLQPLGPYGQYQHQPGPFGPYQQQPGPYGGPGYAASPYGPPPMPHGGPPAAANAWQSSPHTYNGPPGPWGAPHAPFGMGAQAPPAMSPPHPYWRS